MDNRTVGYIGAGGAAGGSSFMSTMYIPNFSFGNTYPWRYTYRYAPFRVLKLEALAFDLKTLFQVLPRTVIRKRPDIISSGLLGLSISGVK